MRRRYVLRPDPDTGELRLVDITHLADAPSRGRLELMTGSFYDGQRSDEGHDISSRRKHQEYMSANGLTHTSDYGPDWHKRVKASKERERKESLKRTVQEAWDAASVRGNRG